MKSGGGGGGDDDSGDISKQQQQQALANDHMGIIVKIQAVVLFKLWPYLYVEYHQHKVFLPIVFIGDSILFYNDCPRLLERWLLWYSDARFKVSTRRKYYSHIGEWKTACRESPQQMINQMKDH